MKSATLRMRIFVPTLILMLGFPIFTYFSFLTLSASYTQNIAEEEIASTLRRIKEVLQTVEVEVVEADADADEEETAKKQAMAFMRAARKELRSKRFDAQIIILDNRLSRILYPSASTDETDAIVAHYKTLLAAEPNADTQDAFENIVFEDQAYRACMIVFNDPGENRANHVIVFSPVIESAPLTQAFATQVLVITAALALLALFVSWQVSGSVHRPIARLCRYMRRIGSGHFESIAPDSTIVEIRELEGAVNDMSMRLKRNDEAQKTFFQNASHELRTPLMSIRGYAEGLKLGILNDTPEAAGIIADESIRLTDLVDELMQLSRMDNDQWTLETQPIELMDFIEGYVRKLDGAALQRGVAVTVEAPDAPIRVAADETLLVKAFTNVLSNAIRYAHTRVCLTLARDGAFAVVRCADDGDGVSEDMRDHLFERFQKGADGHFGIGLAVAKSAMTYMGGAIRLLPTETGATFELRLPLC